MRERRQVGVWVGGISSKSRMVAMGPCLAGWFGEKKKSEKQKTMNEMKRETPPLPTPPQNQRGEDTPGRSLRIMMNDENF